MKQCGAQWRRGASFLWQGDALVELDTFRSLNFTGFRQETCLLT